MIHDEVSDDLSLVSDDQDYQPSKIYGKSKVWNFKTI